MLGMVADPLSIVCRKKSLKLWLINWGTYKIKMQVNSVNVSDYISTLSTLKSVSSK